MSNNQYAVEKTTTENTLGTKFDNGIIIVSASNPVFTKDAGITLDVVFKHMGEEAIPFHAHPDDAEPHGRYLYDEALKEVFGVVGEYERPIPTVHDLQVELDKLWPDVVLGLATEEELSLAKSLRIQIKAMQE